MLPGSVESVHITSFYLSYSFNPIESVLKLICRQLFSGRGQSLYLFTSLELLY